MHCSDESHDAALDSGVDINTRQSLWKIPVVHLVMDCQTGRNTREGGCER